LVILQDANATSCPMVTSLMETLLLRNCDICHGKKDSRHLHGNISYFLELSQFA